VFQQMPDIPDRIRPVEARFQAFSGCQFQGIILTRPIIDL
jgi:hypothetical protein